MKTKPRIYWQWYPKAGRGYWRVSLMPKPFKHTDFPLWEKAHKFVARLNEKQTRVDLAVAINEFRAAVEDINPDKFTGVTH